MNSATLKKHHYSYFNHLVISGLQQNMNSWSIFKQICLENAKKVLPLQAYNQ